jgi:DNA-binding CsgD family transcriptional regulator/tetratricopeptide (TPR) repeat protein
MPQLDPALRLVGRQTEMSRLAAALDAARSGRTCTVFLRGESGIGKTRLLTELAGAARADGVGVLFGSALTVARDAPCWPFQDGLRRFLRDPDNAWAVDALQPWHTYLGTLVPRMPTRTGGPDPPAVPSVDTLLQIAMTLTTHGPLAVLLDDMQWADPSTRTLLAYLWAILADEPVLFVVAYRHEDGEDGSQALHDLAMERIRSRNAELLTPAPLSRDAIRQLVPSQDARLVEEVHARSGGNALFVEEIVRSLQDGHLAAVPDTLRELVRARVRHLPGPAHRVLDALAVEADPVSHRLLAAVVDLDAGLLELIRIIVASGLVTVDTDGEGYRLCHGIVREVLASDLLPGERLALHRRYAQAIEGAAPRDFRTTGHLAVHWREAGEWDRALSAAITAGQDAERAFGFTEARDDWLAALAICDRVAASPDVRQDLQRRAARDAHLIGDHDQAVALITETVATLPDQPTADAALLCTELARYLAAAGRDAEADHAHTRAVDLLPADADPQTRASVLLDHAATLVAAGRYQEGFDQAHAALAVADAAGLDLLRARILPTLGFSLTQLGRPDAGLEAMWQGLRAAESSGVPDVIAGAYVHLCTLLCGPLNRMAEGIDLGRRAVTIVKGLGLARTFAVTLQALVAGALFRVGDWDAAGEVVDAALSAKPTGAAAIELRLARCRLLVNRAAFDAARRDLDALETLCSTTAGPRFRIPVMTLQAGLAMWQRQPTLARQHVARALEETPEDEQDGWLLAPLVWHGFRAEAEAVETAGPRADAADRDQLARLQEWMTRLADHAETAAPQVRAVVHGYARLCEAESTRVERVSDPSAWARAATAWEENLHPYPAAYARFRQAEALFARRTRAVGAPQLLISAYHVARTLGADTLAAEMAALAQRAGVDLGSARSGTTTSPPAPPETAPTGPDPLGALTDRERAVLDGLAQGHSNRQIARALFISDKTVSVHVSRILAKLGVHSRVQAAMVAHRAERNDPDAPPPTSETTADLLRRA